MGVIAQQEAEAAEAECDTALEALSHESMMSAFEVVARATNGMTHIEGVNKTQAEYLVSIKALKAAARKACAN